MTSQQIKALRKAINAAHAVNDVETADALQSILHAYYIQEADAFAKSDEGRKFADYLAKAV